MSDTQASKIQLRRGPQQDLPGGPSAGNPTLPTTGLDVGEPVFTTDTSRVFIGIDPTQGGASVTRGTFPYQNVEVLTEFSPALGPIFDGYLRDLTTAYFNASLNQCDPANPNDWQTLASSTAPGSPAFVVSTTALAMAQITYFLFDAAQTPVRTGCMTVFSTGTSQLPTLSDDYTAIGGVGSATSNSADPSVIYGSTAFRAVLTTTVAGTQVTIQYRNLGPTTQSMFFRIERASAF